MSQQGPILVPLDGSALAEQALPVASSLAKRAGTGLRLIHVHVPFAADPIYVEGLPVLDEHFHSQRRAHEQAYLDGVRARLAGDVPTTVGLVDGPVASTLAEEARANGAPLVVLTTHGRGGLERAWLGSVADEMARVSPVPILLVRAAGTKPAPFRRIIVPLDGSLLAEAILEHAIAMARLDSKPEMVLLQVLEPLPAALVPQSVLAPESVKEEIAHAGEKAARKYLETVAGRVKAAGVNVRIRVDFAANVAGAIMDAAQAEAAEVIALCTHGRSGLLRVARGSVADKIVRASPTAVLLFRPPR